MIRLLNASEKHLIEKVKSLWRQNSASLGFFPDGAFDDHIKKNQVIVSLEEDELLGYLLFRTNKLSLTAAIVHMCIAKQHRNRKISNILFSELVKNLAGYRGISLRCRTDFPAHNLWPKLGFRPVESMRGKRTEESTLIRWWYQIEDKDLFSPLSEKPYSTTIDTNVFINFAENAENNIINIDWLVEIVSFHASIPLHQEIINCKDKEKVSHYLKQLQLLSPQKEANREKLDFAKKSLTGILPEVPRSQSIKDIEHVCHAYACGFNSFLTNDEGLLSLQEEIYKKIGINILSPIDFLLHIDSLIEEQSYTPTRLHGSSLSERNPNSESETIPFRIPSQERKHTFRSNIRKILSKANVTAKIIWIGDSPSAFYAIEFTDNSARIHYFRILNGDLSKTIAREIINTILQKCEAQKLEYIYFSDSLKIEENRAILLYFGFSKTPGDDYVKINKYSKLPADAALAFAKKALSQEHVDSIERLHEGNQSLYIERVLRPIQVHDNRVPCYIIPINHDWARALFEHRLAENDLFDFNHKLLLGTEHAYYRSPTLKERIRSPGKVLWYVSGNRQGAGHIRALSEISDVRVGQKQFVFKDLRRLGIFSWSDVSAIKGKNNMVMGIRFSNTRLISPIPASVIKSILPPNIAKLNFVCPIELCEISSREMINLVRFE